MGKVSALFQDECDARMETLIAQGHEPDEAAEILDRELHPYGDEPRDQP